MSSVESRSPIVAQFRSEVGGNTQIRLVWVATTSASIRMYAVRLEVLAHPVGHSVSAIVGEYEVTIKTQVVQTREPKLHDLPHPVIVFIIALKESKLVREIILVQVLPIFFYYSIGYHFINFGTEIVGIGIRLY